MIPTVYLRSSSMNTWQDYCKLRYYLTYGLGFRESANLKAEHGTTAHKVLEILALCKLALQEGKTSIQDDVIGNFSFSESDLLKESYLSDKAVASINKHRSFKATYKWDCLLKSNKRYGQEFVKSILDKVYDYYQSRSSHEWGPYDKYTIENWIWIPLEWNNGEYDIRKREIYMPEQNFSIEIKKDWAKYSYDLNGEKKDGYLTIKGTIDLITVVDDHLEVIDWKGLPVETKIPSLNGWTTMGELKVGDIIFDKDGKNTKVLAKSRQTYKECYKIYFDDETEAICDCDHLWSLSDGRVVNIKDLKVNDTIDICKPIEYESKLLADPYVLGMFIADKTYSRNIPEIYLQSSVDQRIHLLRGLMDMGGNINSLTKEVVFTTDNKKLSNNVKELLISLGQQVKQISKKRKVKGKDILFYSLRFKPLNINPFATARKAKIIENWKYKKNKTRKIIKIEKLEKKLTQCIMVDSPTSTFLCTENMIPTHNTGQKKDWSTGKVKTFEKLMNDTQLQLYYWAVHQVIKKHANLTIFFIRDGGPTSLAFDEDILEKVEKNIEKIYTEITQSTNPPPRDPERACVQCSWCDYYKNKFPGDTMNICRRIEEDIKEKGIEQVTKERIQSGSFTYQNPGE